LAVVKHSSVYSKRYFNLAATHRPHRQIPLMKDGVVKNRIRGSMDGATMVSWGERLRCWIYTPFYPGRYHDLL
jgi:hypothetical protein